MAEITPIQKTTRRSHRLRPLTHVLGSEENVEPLTPASRNIDTPLTAMNDSLVYNLRQRLEKQIVEKDLGTSGFDSIERTSPGLSKLRMTPGHKLQEKKDLLMRKHEQAKNQNKTSYVGGGVSIWPQMENMRLTGQDSKVLIAAATFTFASVLSSFLVLHGNLMQYLSTYHAQLNQFHVIHLVDVESGQDRLNESLLEWHTAYRVLLEEIKSVINTNLSKTPVFYQVYICLYALGIGVLLYYIADNVFAKNRLTPHRIKIWICLLIAMGTWTILMLQLLTLAQGIETAVESNVYRLSSLMADLVHKDYDLTRYRDIHTYWQTRCLPPTAEGVLTVLDLVAVRDISYYLQYYSLPIITALLTPVVKLINALNEIYSVKPHP